MSDRVIALKSGAADHHPSMPHVGGSAGTAKSASHVYLLRDELTKILGVYGRMVAAGQWRDYSIEFDQEEAAFSIFRRTAEAPLYRIIKAPALARRQGVWRIVSMNGQIVKRGHDLDQLLRYFDRQLVRADSD